MTVKELINELLECDMESDVTLAIKLNDRDLEWDEFTVEVVKTGGGWGKNSPLLAVDLEDKTFTQFAKEVEED